MSQIIKALTGHSGTLNERLSALHNRLLESVPAVDRIACALYDASDDCLRTFINSTRTGHALTGYEYRLSDSRSLQQLALSGEFRVLDELSTAIQSDTAHSKWLLEQGYRSSFTVPMYEAGQLQGFCFFDSCQPSVFTPGVQRDLVLYTSLISMAIASEKSAVRTLIESARVAQELAQVRDFETGKHLERMGLYSHLIAKALAPTWGLSDEFVETVRLFAALHDIGKIAIPDDILLKPGKLSPAERAVMETHVEKGIEIIHRILGKGGLQQLPGSSILENIVAYHHERLDGSGYPHGLQDGQIPLEARIVAVADMLDALTALRPYKDSWTFEEALLELERQAEAGLLDAHCVAAVASNAAQIEQIMAEHRDLPENQTFVYVEP